MLVTTSEKVAFIESVFGRGSIDRAGRNFDVKCPICSSQDSSKKKLSILIETDACHCWVCGFRARNLYPLLLKYSTQEKRNEYKSKFLNSNTWEIEREEKSIIEFPDMKLLTCCDPMDPDVKAVWRYLTHRGLNDRDVWYYRLCLSNVQRWQRRVLVPSFDELGNMNYLVGRAIDSTRRPKYDNVDVDRLSIVFNDINIDWTKKLVVCEGPFDMFKCGMNATCLLGSDLNETSALFTKIVINKTPIALALDHDMLSTKIPKIVKKLEEYDIDVVLVDVESDPGDMTQQEFAIALDQAHCLSWKSAFETRLERSSSIRLNVR